MSDVKQHATPDFETELLHQLHHCGIPQERLRELVASIAGLDPKLLFKARIFPKGTILAPTHLMVRSLISEPDIGGLIDRLLNTKVVRAVFVFPYGVPLIQGYQVDISVGGGPEIVGAQAGD